MTRNLGQLDRIARLVLGAFLIALAALGLVGAWGYVGVILVAAATVNFCPIYRIFGLKTCTEC